LISSSKRIAILTCERDFHAYAIRSELANRGIDCSIIEANNLAGSGFLSWSPNTGANLGQVGDVDGNVISVPELDVLWWRRLNGTPNLPENIACDARDFVVNECRSALLGLITTSFNGRWVSHPEATRVAENKLVQLKVATEVGFRIPRTLVSQDPDAVRSFCDANDYQVVVKSVTGTPGTPTLTGQITPNLVADDLAIRLSPAIYQELIPGTRHFRACCFGEVVHTTMLISDRLDWRHPLDADVQPYQLDKSTNEMLCSVLKKLGLRMGIFDLKLTPDGEIVWLEVNPQGQFLFLEGMGSTNLTSAFADFLQNEI